MNTQALQADDPKEYAPELTQETAKAWDSVKDQLKLELGDATYSSWIAPIKLLGLLNNQLCIAVSTRFLRDWIVTHYQQRIFELFQKSSTSTTEVVVLIQADSHTPMQASNENHEEGLQGSTLAKSIDDVETELDVSLDKRFTFDNFVIGKSNELAYAAARRVAEQENVSFNPLFLYGGVGLGKTHLMHAIAWHIITNQPWRKILYLSAEKFMYRFIQALRRKDTMAFKEQFRSVDVLMIDDVQFIAGKDSTQEEFFHTFNALVDQNRQVIISADKSPSDLEGMEDRLKSRLGWGLVADIHPTNYELRLGILQSKSEKFKVSIDDRVLEFLAHKITSNIRELEGALNRLAAHASLVSREIDIEMTRDVLQDLIRANDRHLTIEDIQKSVAEHYNIRISDLHSVRRSRSIARPRQVAMYLAKQLTERSFPEIGRKFGGRDHTTVLHAVRKVEELCEEDKEFADDLDILKKSLQV